MPKKTGLSMKCPHCDGTGQMPMERADFGTMLLARRRAAGLTQDELAKKILKSRAQIANLEGGRGDPSMKTVRAIAEALGCSARDLIPE